MSDASLKTPKSSIQVVPLSDHEVERVIVDPQDYQVTVEKKPVKKLVKTYGTGSKGKTPVAKATTEYGYVGDTRHGLPGFSTSIHVDTHSFGGLSQKQGENLVKAFKSEMLPMSDHIFKEEIEDVVIEYRHVSKLLGEKKKQIEASMGTYSDKEKTRAVIKQIEALQTNINNYLLEGNYFELVVTSDDRGLVEGFDKVVQEMWGKGGKVAKRKQEFLKAVEKSDGKIVDALYLVKKQNKNRQVLRGVLELGSYVAIGGAMVAGGYFMGEMIEGLNNLGIDISQPYQRIQDSMDNIYSAIQDVSPQLANIIGWAGDIRTEANALFDRGTGLVEEVMNIDLTPFECNTTKICLDADGNGVPDHLQPGYQSFAEQVWHDYGDGSLYGNIEAESFYRQYEAAIRQYELGLELQEKALLIKENAEKIEAAANTSASALNGAISDMGDVYADLSTIDEIVDLGNANLNFVPGTPGYKAKIAGKVALGVGLGLTASAVLGKLFGLYIAYRLGKKSYRLYDTIKGEGTFPDHLGLAMVEKPYVGLEVTR